MKVHLPNSAFLGNIDAFFSSLDLSDRDSLYITANKKWISVHPLVLTMAAALGKLVPAGSVICEAFEAKSKHYFERMGLFRLLGVDSGIQVTEHEAAGRFVSLTEIRDSASLSTLNIEMPQRKHTEPHRRKAVFLLMNTQNQRITERKRTEETSK